MVLWLLLLLSLLCFVSVSKLWQCLCLQWVSLVVVLVAVVAAKSVIVVSFHTLMNCCHTHTDTQTTTIKSIAANVCAAAASAAVVAATTDFAMDPLQTNNILFKPTRWFHRWI